MKRRTKGIIIASAVAASLIVGACSQKPPAAGSATMVKSANQCNANQCKVNQCKANKKADN